MPGREVHLRTHDAVHASGRGAVSGMRVAITGAGGYLGRETLRCLHAEGTEAVVLRREAHETSRWVDQLRDVEVVIHLAAPTSGLDPVVVADALDCTQRLVDSLPKRPLRFVLASSLALMRPRADDGFLDEASSTYDGRDLLAQDLYTQMKSEQEAMVRTACAEHGWGLTILRPSNVWDQERWLQPCVGPKAGPFWFVVAPRRRLRLVHRANCARAFVDAIHLPIDAGVQVVVVDDEAGITAWHYATKTIDSFRRRYVPIPVPGSLFEVLTTLAATVLRLVAPLRRVPGLLLSQRRVARFGAYRIDSRLARERIRWTPDLTPYGLPERR